MSTDAPVVALAPAIVPVVALDSMLSPPVAAGVLAILDAAERRCAALVRGAEPVVDVTAPPYAVTGLRLPALLMVLAALPHDGDGDGPIVDAAALLTLTELALAYHRRGAGSRDVLAGDLLIVRATGLVADLPTAVSRLWADGLRVAHELALVGRPRASAAAVSHYAVAVGRRLAPGRREMPAAELIRALSAITRTEPAPP